MERSTCIQRPTPAHLLQIPELIAGQRQGLEPSEGAEAFDLCQAVVGEAEVPQVDQLLQTSHLLNVIE